MASVSLIDIVPQWMPCGNGPHSFAAVDDRPTHGRQRLQDVPEAEKL